MSTYGDLLAIVKYVGERTGDPNAWQAGLTPDEVIAVSTPLTPTERLEAIVGKIRRQHAELFGAPSATPQEGAAAEAIRSAEAALAHQNSANAQLDLQVISAILNAHTKTVDGNAALAELQRETETAVLTRSDLDTPAGARDFQRFLIGKLRDIRAVVADVSLDDTSKSALMAAWTSLYNASKAAPGIESDNAAARPSPAGPDRAPSSSQPMPGASADPYPSPELFDDAAMSPLDAQAVPAGSAPAPAATTVPSVPAVPSIPGFGAGAVPASLPGLGEAGGLPLSRLLGGGHERDLDGEDPECRAEDEPEDRTEEDAAEEAPEAAPSGPTTITLPNGETVTAASPQIAAAIKAAAMGTPIADAFRQQGISIPPPGTPVAEPVDPPSLTPGDVGVFTDRHALAIGHSKALLDGQIQQVSAVSGPSFLGWEHPPAPAEEARSDAPTPTRPAAVPIRSTTSQ